MHRALTAAFLILGLTPGVTAAHTSGRVPLARISGFAVLFLTLIAGLTAGIYVLLGRDMALPRPAISLPDGQALHDGMAGALAATRDRIAEVIESLQQGAGPDHTKVPRDTQHQKADLDTLVRDTGRLADLLEQRDTILDRQALIQALGKASDAVMDDEYETAHHHIQQIIRQLDEQ